MRRARLEKARVSRNMAMYVLMEPCCVLLMVEIMGVFRLVAALGPIFSSQVRSIVWLAMVWPRARFIFGGSRWKIFGKNPSMLEKWWGVSSGVVLVCFVVNEASSRAVRRPMRVTIRAASFRSGGMDMMGVFIGIVFAVMIKPAMMLPQASRLIGLITAGLFSLIGERALNRGWPMDTKNTTRRL